MIHGLHYQPKCKQKAFGYHFIMDFQCFLVSWSLTTSKRSISPNRSIRAPKQNRILKREHSPSLRMRPCPCASSASLLYCVLGSVGLLFHSLVSVSVPVLSVPYNWGLLQKWLYCQLLWAEPYPAISAPGKETLGANWERRDRKTLGLIDGPMKKSKMCSSLGFKLKCQHGAKEEAHKVGKANMCFQRGDEAKLSGTDNSRISSSGCCKPRNALIWIFIATNMNVNRRNAQPKDER